MLVNLTNEFQEVQVTQGTYQTYGIQDEIEVCISDTKPENLSGIIVRGSNSSERTIRNFDTKNSKIWFRSLRGTGKLLITEGFL